MRSADDGNPRGYYEFEPAKKTAKDATWISAARGKAVKLVSALLYALPPSEKYRVIFMRRDIDEVLTSQEALLRRLGRMAAPRDQMRNSCKLHLDRLLRWFPEQSHLRVIEVSYNDLIVDANADLQRIDEFLDGRPNLADMKQAIIPSLYRSRVSAVDAESHSER